MARISRVWSAAMAAAMVAGVAGCGNGDESADAPGAGGTTDPCGFSAELVQAAQSEGQVTLFSTLSEDMIATIASKFEATYGISVNSSRHTGGDLIQIVNTAFEARNVPADVLQLSELSAVGGWTAEGRLTELEIPNLNDVNEGLRDPSRASWPFAFTTYGILYNSARLDEGDLPQSWDALVNDLGDRVIVMASPATAGGALSLQYGLGKIMGEDYIARFADKGVLVTESSLSLDQFILTGEADFALPALESQVLNVQQAGEPLAMVYPEEGVPAATLEVAALADSSSPSAGQLLAQWMLCEDFQEGAHELGFRPVLGGLPIPDGAADLTGRNVVAVDVSDLAETREAVISRFNDAVG